MNTPFFQEPATASCHFAWLIISSIMRDYPPSPCHTSLTRRPIIMFTSDKTSYVLKARKTCRTLVRVDTDYNYNWSRSIKKWTAGRKESSSEGEDMANDGTIMWKIWGMIIMYRVCRRGRDVEGETWERNRVRIGKKGEGRQEMGRERNINQCNKRQSTCQWRHSTTRLARAS